MAYLRKELIVFDWDGTLADSTSLIASSIQRACRDLELSVPDDLAARYVIGLGFHDAMRHVAPMLAAEEYMRFGERYRQYYVPGEDDILLFEGAREMLERLVTRGHRLAVATGKGRRGLDKVLEQQSLGHLFCTSRCADEGMPKPHADMLLRIMEQTGVAAAQTVMVGDTAHDLLLARNAGVDAIAVSYGAHPVDEFETFAPLATVHSIAELDRWFESNA